MNTLNLTTLIDQYGLRSFHIDGEVIDPEDNKPFHVGEFTFNAVRANMVAEYYRNNFNCQINRITETENV